MGKVKELTEKQKNQLEALGAVLSIEQIAGFFGISKVTFYKMMERDPEVKKLYKIGKSKAIANVAKGLLKEALPGEDGVPINRVSAMFYLKTQAGWRETTKLEHTGADGGPIQATNVDLSKLSDAALNELEKAIKDKP